MEFAIGRDLFRGWEAIRVFGHNPDLDMGTEDLWEVGGTRTDPTSAAVISTVSTSTSDAAAGTGIQTVEFEGLDANFDRIKETITLNGTDAVTTTLSFLRINSMTGKSAGTGQEAAGIITASIGGNAQSQINVGEGADLSTHYTVPAGHTLFVQSFLAGTGRIGAGDVIVRLQSKLEPDDVWVTLTIFDPYQVTFNEDGLLGFQICPEKTEMRVTGEANINNLAVFSGWHGILVLDTIV